jgi:hypothetical protein
VLRRRRGEALAQQPPPFPGVNSPLIVAARDREAVDRILALGPAPPAVLASLADRFPNGRVTVLGADGERTFLDRGLETLPQPEDPASWFRARRYHYSAVVLRGPAAQAWAGPHLDEHQPQALRIYDMGSGDGGMEGSALRRSEMDALAAANSVLCRTEAQGAVAAGAGRTAIRYAEEDLPEVLLGELATLGLVGALAGAP